MTREVWAALSRIILTIRDEWPIEDAYQQLRTLLIDNDLAPVWIRAQEGMSVERLCRLYVAVCDYDLVCSELISFELHYDDDRLKFVLAGSQNDGEYTLRDLRGLR